MPTNSLRRGRSHWVLLFITIELVDTLRRAMMTALLRNLVSFFRL